MKSFAIMLGAAVCLASLAASAADKQNKKYWEQRDVDPATRDDTKLTPDSKAWEARNADVQDDSPGERVKQAADRVKDTVTGGGDTASDSPAMRDPDAENKIGISVEAGGG